MNVEDKAVGIVVAVYALVLLGDRSLLVFRWLDDLPSR